MITKPENWKLLLCAGFLRGSAETEELELSTTCKNALNEVAEWLMSCEGGEQ